MELETIAEGLLFPEGPVLLADGSVIFVEIARGTLSWARNGGVEVVAELGGGPNGAALGPDGAIYVCNNGGRFDFAEADGLRFPGPRPPAHCGGSIQRVDLATASVETIYEACDGRPLLAPNDLVFDRGGGFWFTDHGTGADDGGLFHARPDGSQITRWLEAQHSPNGVGLSPDERVVYVADTGRRTVRAFELAAPGVLAGPASGGADRLLAQLPEGHLPDSLAVEASGKVCVGTLLNGGITVVDPGGAVEHVPVPDLMTTNLCFGGADLRDAVLTLSSTGKLARARWPRPGLKLNFSA
jgi:gluconolactonase